MSGRAEIQTQFSPRPFHCAQNLPSVTSLQLNSPPTEGQSPVSFSGGSSLQPLIRTCPWSLQEGILPTHSQSRGPGSPNRGSRGNGGGTGWRGILSPKLVLDLARNDSLDPTFSPFRLPSREPSVATRHLLAIPPASVLSFDHSHKPD